MKTTSLLLIVTLGTAAGCASHARAQEYEQLAAQARQEIELADKAGFLWLHTEDIMKQAEAAKNAGELDQAIELARTAAKEARLAQVQAREQAHPKMSFPGN